MHFRGAAPASFTGAFDPARSARDGATPCRWRFAQVRSDDALYPQVDFVRPIEVGALLALKSHVVHVCDQGRVCVDVTAAVWKPGLRESTLTNNFSFVFDASKAPRPLKDVLPVVRTEAAMQLDAIERMTNCD